MACHKKTKLWDHSSKDISDMKTTTQLMLEQGSRAQRTACVLERKLVNFQSFNMDDPRYGAIEFEDELEPPLQSNYMRNFSAPYPSRCKPLQPKTGTPDFLFNRLPKNDFDGQTGIAFKFLDDHLVNPTEVRKKINFFRQLRNQSFLKY